MPPELMAVPKVALHRPPATHLTPDAQFERAQSIHESLFLYGSASAFLGAVWAMRPVFHIVETIRHHQHPDMLRLLAEVQLAVVLFVCGITIVRTPAPVKASTSEELVLWPYTSLQRLLRVVVWASVSLTLLALHSLHQNLMRVLHAGAP